MFNTYIGSMVAVCLALVATFLLMLSRPTTFFHRTPPPPPNYQVGASEPTTSVKEKSTTSSDVFRNYDNEVYRSDSGTLIYPIPFTIQAPLAEWDNPIFQDGCEEASAYMVIMWLRGEDITPAKARQEIISLSAWQVDNYGSAVDTSVVDTARRIFVDYYKTAVKVKIDVKIKDLIDALDAGFVIVAPFNGQKLNNPHYANEGPLRHNLVIRGYDPSTKEFITNDPGTKYGEAYRYSYNVLYEALGDYPTGDHEEIESRSKSIILISGKQ